MYYYSSLPSTLIYKFVFGICVLACQQHQLSSDFAAPPLLCKFYVLHYPFLHNIYTYNFYTVIKTIYMTCNDSAPKIFQFYLTLHIIYDLNYCP